MIPDLDLFGASAPPPSKFASTPAEQRRAKRRQYDKPRGYAATPGTGPANHTCRDCRFARIKAKLAKNYWGCWLMHKLWRGGPKTDIRLKSAACSHWLPTVQTDSPFIQQNEP